MSTRRAVITGVGKPLKLEECDVINTPAKGARIRIECAGVCHSDVAFINAIVDLGNGETLDFSKTQGNYEGCTVGHEIAGVVDEIGSEIDTSAIHVKVGDRVAVYPTMGCETGCPPCNAQHYYACNNAGQDVSEALGFGSLYGGGFATHCTVPHLKTLVPLHQEIPSDIGCMLGCSALSSYGALVKCKPTLIQAYHMGKRPARLLIIGAGGLGLWAVRLARNVLRYHDVARDEFCDLDVDITVADLNQEKLDMAKEAGADKTVQWNADADIQVIVDETGAKTFDAVIDLVGTSVTSKIGLQCLAPLGTLILVGFHGGNINYPIPSILLGPISIQGSKNGSVRELRELTSLIKEAKITYPWVEQYRLDDVNEVIGKLDNGKIRGRAVLMIQESSDK